MFSSLVSAFSATTLSPALWAPQQFLADVTAFASIPAIATKAEHLLEGNGLNLLINNAGIVHRGTLGEVTLDQMRGTMDVNCMAPMFITQVWRDNTGLVIIMIMY